MSNYVMVDLETLDTKDNAIVLSIGACSFNDTAVQTYDELNEPSNKFYAELNINEQEKLGRTIGLDTLRWWLSQSNFKLHPKEIKFTLSTTYFLNNLTHFIGTNGSDGVWSNGPAFDMRILESLYQTYDMNFNTNFKQWFDFRTIKEVAKLLDIPTNNFIGIKHNALNDAINQALVVNNTLMHIKSINAQLLNNLQKIKLKNHDMDSEYDGGPRIEDLDLIYDLNN